MGAKPTNISSAEQSAEEQIDNIRGASDKFRLVSRSEGLVGNKHAVLIDIEAERGGQEALNLTLHVVDRGVVWQVVCGSFDPDEFIQVAEICPQIVKSFRLLQ